MMRNDSASSMLIFLGLQYSIDPKVTIAFCNFKYFTFMRDPNWTLREIM